MPNWKIIYYYINHIHFSSNEASNIKFMKLSKIVNLKKVTLQNYLKKITEMAHRTFSLFTLREYKVPLTFFLSVFVSF